MREIKFRGMTDKHVWVYGWFTDDDLSPDIIDGMSTRHKVLSKTVGQFTGLKDHKGREIYEGDIINNTRESYFIWYKDEWAAFVARPTSDGNDVYLLDEVVNTPINRLKVTVIGNVHDNPELLEVEE